MKASSLVDIAAAIVMVALVSVVVTSPNTSQVISAMGNTFAGAIKAAKG